MFYNLLVSFLSTMSLVYSIFLLALPDFFARITGDALSLLNSLIFNLLGWTAFSLDIYSVSISLSGAVIAACAVITLLAFVYYFDVRRIFKKKEKEGGGIKPAPLAAQKLSAKLKNRIRFHVCLGKHGSASLYQNLVFNQCGNFLGHLGIPDA